MKTDEPEKPQSSNRISQRTPHITTRNVISETGHYDSSQKNKSSENITARSRAFQYSLPQSRQIPTD